VTPEAASKTVLIADDELNMRRVLEAILRREGYDVITAANGVEALSGMSANVHTVITDLKMPGLDGMGLLKKLSADYPDVPVVMITAHGSVENAVEAVKLGAFDYLEKPFEQEQIRQIVSKAMNTYALARRDASPEVPAGRGRFKLIGQSGAIRQIFVAVEKVADTPSTVLITGESGTGKELIARALHENSSRHTGPFIKINCAAIPKTLMESELFGYDKGAFTGAVGAKPGRFELAHGGTLFLDEIGEIPIDMQVKLLRVLQESEFERVGGIKTIKVDVRLVAATNRDLAQEVATGGFREDLYYRLNVVPLHLPPLRERREDIPFLANHFIAKFNDRLKKQDTGITSEAVQRLVVYHWPGNIRELENVMERTILFSEGPEIRLENLPPELLHLGPTPLPAEDSGGRVTGPGMAAVGAPGLSAAAAFAAGGSGPAPTSATPTPISLPAPFVPTSAAPPNAASSLKEAVRAETERVERELIQRALDETGGNVTQAARKLKISRKSLQTKMKEFGLRDREITKQGDQET
jgi:DNA-binding NtrC family response regulator